MVRQLCLVALLCLACLSVSSGQPYNSPTVDGQVSTNPGDWSTDEWVVDDVSDDNRWYPSDPDLDDLYVTWDGTALYVGLVTARGPGGYGNGYLLFVDTDVQNGITGATDYRTADFYARQITFSGAGIDLMMGCWNLEIGSMGVRHCADPPNTTPVASWTGLPHPGWLHIEFSVPWESIFENGPGQVPPGTTMRFVAAIVGGDGSGAYDAMPTSSTGIESDPSTPWNATTELDVYYEVVVDSDQDGIPDSHASPVESTSWGAIKHVLGR